MNRYSWLEGYLLSMPGAVTDYKLEWQWQRYLVGGRMFAAVCTPGPEHAAHAGRTMVILKCDPRLAEAFREQYPEVVPGFYSDKRNWNSVYLGGPKERSWNRKKKGVRDPCIMYCSSLPCSRRS